VKPHPGFSGVTTPRGESDALPQDEIDRIKKWEEFVTSQI
jgi:hypothetical protein